MEEVGRGRCAPFKSRRRVAERRMIAQLVNRIARVVGKTERGADADWQRVEGG